MKQPISNFNWVSVAFHYTDPERWKCTIENNDTTPEVFRLAIKGEEILQIMEPCSFDTADTIAKLINRPRQYTRELLEEMAEAGLLCTDEDNDPDGEILYGYLY